MQEVGEGLKGRKDKEFTIKEMRRVRTGVLEGFDVEVREHPRGTGQTVVERGEEGKREDGADDGELGLASLGCACV